MNTSRLDLYFTHEYRNFENVVSVQTAGNQLGVKKT